MYPSKMDKEKDQTSRKTVSTGFSVPAQCIVNLKSKFI